MTRNRTIEDETIPGGFGTVDEKGRVSLPKTVRKALGVEPGSQVAYIVIDGAVIIVPQDEHLAALMRRAEQALASAGLTSQDLIEELPAARAEVVAEAYGEDFVRELEQQHTEWHAANKRR